MALVPSISLALGNKCNTITLTESTNPYTFGSNDGGWGSPNIDTTDVVSAKVEILPFTENSVSTSVGSGTISGTTFTDTTHISGIFTVGQYLSGLGVAPGTQITALITGTGNNNGGTYTVNISQTVALTTITGTSALSTFTIKNGTTDLYTLLSNNPTPLEGAVISDATWNQKDGIYHPIYTVETATDVYLSPTEYVLFTCNICSCFDQLVLKLINACSSEDVKKYKTQVDQMDVFIYGIQTAFACGDFDTADAIIAAAGTYCQTLVNCGCGCGGKC